MRGPEVVRRAERGIAEPLDQRALLGEEIARLRGPREQAQDVGEAVHDVEPAVIAVRRREALGVTQGVAQDLHRLRERVPPRDLVGEVNEVRERARGLVRA